LLAKAALPDYFHRNNGDAIHHGNLVLGRFALKSGDVEKAKEYLLKAGQTSGSPVLCSGGPNMMLAKELLESGEREVVIQYLKALRQFQAHFRPSSRKVDLRNRTGNHPPIFARTWRIRAPEYFVKSYGRAEFSGPWSPCISD
jgi:hypothetical protein